MNKDILDKYMRRAKRWKTPYINLDVVKLSHRTMSAELGNIDDLPHDIANAIANVYYRFHYISMYIITHGNTPNWLPKEFIGASSNLVDGIMFFKAVTSLCEVQKDAILGFVADLRKIDKQQYPRDYKYLTDYVRDTIKYSMSAPEYMSWYRRRLERLRVGNRDMPGLLTYMQKL